MWVGYRLCFQLLSPCMGGLIQVIFRFVIIYFQFKMSGDFIISPVTTTTYTLVANTEMNSYMQTDFMTLVNQCFCVGISGTWRPCESPDKPQTSFTQPGGMSHSFPEVFLIFPEDHFLIGGTEPERKTQNMIQPGKAPSHQPHRMLAGYGSQASLCPKAQDEKRA